MIEEDCYAALSEEGEVTARNVLTQLLRLSQVTGGYIRNDADATAMEVSTAKLEALEDIIDSCMDEGKKVVVFARFVPEIEAIEKMLKKKGLGYSLIYGATKDRADQVKQFQEDPNVKVFVGQLQTTGMGLTLTAANVAVFYSLDFSYANYEQSRARIHRIGQKEKCLYIHLVCKGTVDEKVMSALQKKGDIAKLMVDDWRKLLNGQN
jgi:SNF2 family DNA or RNA helicase